MRVGFRLFGSYRSLAGVTEASIQLVEGAELESALGTLGKVYPTFPDASMCGRGLILINGVEHRNLDGMKTVLSDGSIVVLIPVVHGG